MIHKKNFAGIDNFRFAAAFMVIAIHVSPFQAFHETVDFLITYCLCRIAVPFFFMTTGFFVLAPYLRDSSRKKRAVERFLLKNSALYLAATLLYLPLILYSGKLAQTIPALLRQLFFDGAFYHLWYFPAVLTGCLLLMPVSRRSLTAAAVFSLAAYVIGLFGDSYYGLIQNVPAISSFYDGIFCISSHTRNGIFFAPIFLLLGALTAVYRIRFKKNVCVWGLGISLALLLAEGYLTYCFQLQKHNSMYVFLLPALFFLFQLLLSAKGQAPAWIRDSSMLLYIIHPAVIILWRGLAKAVKQTELLVENTLIAYLAVCTLSLAAVYLIQFFKGVIAACTKKDAHGSN